MTVFYSLETIELPRLLYESGIIASLPSTAREDELERTDLTAIKQFGLRVCLGKEWYRFPGHYLVPDGIRVDFVKSEFEGMLPGHFGEGDRMVPDAWVSGLWKREETRHLPLGLNDLNREEPSYYVRCQYLFSLRTPSLIFIPYRYQWRPATILSTWTFLFTLSCQSWNLATQSITRNGKELPARLSSMQIIRLY